MTAVWFWNPADATDERGFWDQGLLEELFAGEAWRAAGAPAYEVREPVAVPPEGAVIVVPGQHCVEHADWIGEVARTMPWALVIVTSDEEALFPVERLPRDAEHAVWTQYHDRGMDAVIPLGAPPGTRAALRPSGPRHYDWFFAGQTTHPRRAELVEVMNGLLDDVAIAFETDGFGPGAAGALERDAYLWRMAHAAGAPCPSGPHSLDSFRLYEALEAGAVPVVEQNTPHGPEREFWPAVLPGGCPIPVVEEWGELAGIAPTAQLATRCGAYWRGRVRNLARELRDTVAALSGASTWSTATSVRDVVTVIVTTSPTRQTAEAQFAMLTETLRSIRAYPELSDAEVIVAADGVRPEQRLLRPVYEEFLALLVGACRVELANVVPVILGAWGHQANVMRAALALVDTPLVLFAEHDTPFVPEPIDWGAACATVLNGDLDLVRFLHESHVLAEHRHLLLGDGEPLTSPAGLPYLRTYQWSQRPHLAATGWYERQIETYFAPESRTMIEDVMHGVVDYYVRERGEGAWEAWKLGIYAPEGHTLQRTTHTDGRGESPKYAMVYSYPDGGTPEGAPRASADRVD